MSGIAVNYRHSPIVEEHPVDGAGPRAGDRPPDAPISDAAGRALLRLYELFAKHRHTLLLLGNAPEDLAAVLSDYRERHFAIRPVTAAATAGGDLIDRAGMVAAQYGSPPGRVSDPTGRLYRFPLPVQRGVGATAALLGGAVWRFRLWPPRLAIARRGSGRSGRRPAPVGGLRRPVRPLRRGRRPPGHRRAGDDIEIIARHGVTSVLQEATPLAATFGS